MADDICFNLAHAKELIRNECCDVISVYPGKNGGIRKTREIVEYAAAHGVACSIGSNLEWDVATAAMGHVVVALANMQVEALSRRRAGSQLSRVPDRQGPTGDRGAKGHGPLQAGLGGRGRLERREGESGASMTSMHA